MSVENPNGALENASKIRRPKGLIPIHSGQECLKVVHAIRDNNGGKPYSKILLAQALGKSATSSGFETLLAACVRYGMIVYERGESVVALTDLGRRLAYPQRLEEEIEAVREAVFRIPLFKSVLTHFKNSRIPESGLFQNTLIRQFEVPAEFAKHALDAILEAAKWAQVLTDNKGATFVLLDKAPSAPLISTLPLPETEASGESNGRDSDVSLKDVPSEGMTSAGSTEPPVVPPSSEVSTPASTKVFIAHSKNSEILGQVKKLFDATGVEYVIAEEEETTAVPVPKKVADAMRRCNGAIINVSADPHEKTSDGEFRVNQNVLIEIGAAFVMYEDRVVLLWDTRVPVPSNLSGLYRCQYSGDSLSLEDGIKLIAALKSRNREAN